MRECLIRYGGSIYKIDKVIDIEDLIYRICERFLEIIEKESEGEIINEREYICPIGYKRIEEIEENIEEIREIRKFKVYGYKEENGEYILLKIDGDRTSLYVGIIRNEIICYC